MSAIFGYYANGRKKKYSSTNKSKPVQISEPATGMPDYNFRPRRGSSTAHIKSYDSGTHISTAPVKQEYTGDLVKGIGQLHKSNAVPVIDEQYMKDLANMRRTQ
jgi:hypothetical protein